MAETVVRTRASRATVQEILRDLPRLVCSDDSAALETVGNIGTAILEDITRAFVVKSHGGTDEAGERWKPLSPYTIAKRLSRGLGGNPRPSKALTNDQQARWWEVYRRSLARYKGDKAHAAAAAWFVVKREGATTLVDKYGYRQVEILRDTGKLLNSLTPGVEAEGKIFRVNPGEVEVGSDVEYASAHHKGIPNKLPQRRLWPEPGRWPTNWWNHLLQKLTDGVVELATRKINEAVT